jgi:hypothetical protein
MSNDPPWSSIPLADRLYLVYLEAGRRRFPAWLETIYETLERLKEQSRLASPALIRIIPRSA